MEKKSNSPLFSKNVTLAYAILAVLFLYFCVRCYFDITSFHSSVAKSIDPDYHYLFNGLLVANFRVPFHTEHPGTPLQDYRV